MADFFVQQRTTKDYTPSRKQIKHGDEILKLLEVLSDDRRFAEIDMDSLKEQTNRGRTA